MPCEVDKDTCVKYGQCECQDCAFKNDEELCKDQRKIFFMRYVQGEKQC